MRRKNVPGEMFYLVAYHVVGVLIRILLVVGTMIAGYLALENYGQWGINLVILVVAYFRLRHDIKAIQNGEVELPPEYRNHQAGSGQNFRDNPEAGRSAQADPNPIRKSGR